MKICATCRENKPIAEYSPQRGQPFGVASYCRPCNAQYSRAWRADNREAYLQLRRAYHAKLREEALFVLGGRCAHCGIDDLRLLDIDHVRNNGAEERKASSHLRIVRKVIDGDAGYQALCCNCHRLKTLHGGVRD